MSKKVTKKPRGAAPHPRKPKGKGKKKWRRKPLLKKSALKAPAVQDAVVRGVTPSAEFAAVEKGIAKKPQFTRAERRAAERVQEKAAKRKAAIRRELSVDRMASEILEGSERRKSVPQQLDDLLSASLHSDSTAYLRYHWTADHLRGGEASDIAAHRDDASRQLRRMRGKSREALQALSRHDYLTALNLFEDIHTRLEFFQPGLSRERILTTAILGEMHRAVVRDDGLVTRQWQRQMGAGGTLDANSLLAQKAAYLVNAHLHASTALLMAKADAVERSVDAPSDDDPYYRSMSGLLNPLHGVRAAVKDGLDDLIAKHDGSLVGFFIKNALEQYFGDIDAVSGVPTTMQEYVRDFMVGDLANDISSDGHELLNRQLRTIDMLAHTAFTIASNMIKRNTSGDIAADIDDKDGAAQLFRRLQSVLVRGFGTKGASVAMNRLYATYFYTGAKYAQERGDWVAELVRSGSKFERGDQFTNANAIPCYERGLRMLDYILATSPGHEQILELREQIERKLAAVSGDAPASRSMTQDSSVTTPSTFTSLYEAAGKRLVPPQRQRASDSELPSAVTRELAKRVASRMPTLAQSLLFFNDQTAIGTFDHEEGSVHIPRGLYALTEEGMSSRGDVTQLVSSLGLEDDWAAASIWNLWIDAATNNLDFMAGYDLDPSIGTFPGLTAMTMLRRFAGYVAAIEMPDVPASNIMHDVMYDTVCCGLAMRLDPVEVWEVAYAMPELSMANIGTYKLGDIDSAISRLRDERGSIVYPELAAFAERANDGFAHAIFLARTGMSFEREGDPTEAMPFYNNSYMALQRVRRQREDIPASIMQPLMTRVDGLRQNLLGGAALVQRGGRDLARDANFISFCVRSLEPQHDFQSEVVFRCFSPRSGGLTSYIKYIPLKYKYIIIIYNYISVFPLKPRNFSPLRTITL